MDYTGCTEAARILNFDTSTITKVCKGKQKQTGGYVFRYKDDPDLEGEIWVMNTHVGILVSNLGRAKTLVKQKGLSAKHYSIILYVSMESRINYTD